MSLVVIAHLVLVMFVHAVASHSHSRCYHFTVLVLLVALVHSQLRSVLIVVFDVRLCCCFVLTSSLSLRSCSMITFVLMIFLAALDHSHQCCLFSRAFVLLTLVLVTRYHVVPHLVLRFFTLTALMLLKLTTFRLIVSHHWFTLQPCSLSLHYCSYSSSAILHLSLSFILTAGSVHSGLGVLSQYRHCFNLALRSHARFTLASMYSATALTRNLGLGSHWLRASLL